MGAMKTKSHVDAAFQGVEYVVSIIVAVVQAHKLLLRVYHDHGTQGG